jgi:hypothetical protein
MDRPTLVAIVVFALIGWGAWAFWQKVIGDFNRGFEAARQAEQAKVGQPAPSAQPVLVALPGQVNWFLTNWGVAAALFALALMGQPELLWTRWLAWPASALLLVLGPVMVAAGWKGPDQQLQVGPAGLVLRETQRDGSQRVLREAGWAQVQQVVVVRNRNLNGPRTDRLVFELADGQPFASVPVPVQGDAEWQRLMDSLPPWTGRPLTAQRR